MSVELVKQEIQKFLERDDAYVLCLRGKWGVGKTYAWKTQLDAFSNHTTYTRYSYVSLFGLNSLSDLKIAIFENAVVLPTSKSGLVAQGKNFLERKLPIGKAAAVVPKLPFVNKYATSELTSHIFFQSISQYLICVDDIERRGKGLAVGDVLGMISFLRESRSCKVILVLNDEALEGSDKQEFERNLEKVVDTSMVYEPTAEEAVKIAITKSDATDLLIRERCSTLGISNIRIIKRAASHIEALRPLVSELDEQVFRSAVSSIVLFSWSRYQPEDAPTFEFLKALVPKMVFALSKGEDASPKEAAWRALLDVYQYSESDEFDLELMNGVRDGYFNPERIKTTAKVLHDKLVAAKLDGSFEQAWNLYHDSFLDNEDEVLGAIYDAFKKAVQRISPTNLDGTIVLFKELGKPEKAQELLDCYMKNREGDRQFFDLSENPFGSNVVDPDVRQAFDDRAAETQETRDIVAIILSISDGWADEDIDTLAATPVEEYRKIFKSKSGAELRRVLSNIFQFDRISNATEKMKQITARAREALRQIGAESGINARRVSRYGIRISTDGNV